MRTGGWADSVLILVFSLRGFCDFGVSAVKKGFELTTGDAKNAEVTEDFN